MATELFDNATSPGAATALVAPISDSDTVLPVTGPASTILQTPGGQFRVIVIDVVSQRAELMLVTANAWTPNWTVTRGVEGTAPLAFPAGSKVRHTLTAQGLKNLIAQGG